ncbi:MAG TPA: hypothetical protein VE954_00610 [Oligoflexus sp.]|uniref:hypothetical protein n=1 Tax=Oligoflexus sp. TaxID=1971216 RepID=UPI002D4E308B|nr:hypothetical protein [Oligoflexus sp.]HYX31580.1 hypothetical protein [Oligoflexus sp.]
MSPMFQSFVDVKLIDDYSWAVEGILELQFGKPHPPRVFLTDWIRDPRHLGLDPSFFSGRREDRKNAMENAR